MEKQRWEQSEKRKRQRKEDAGARKGRKLAIHCVFPMICGSGGSKSRLAKAAGAEPAGQMRDEKLKKCHFFAKPFLAFFSCQLVFLNKHALRKNTSHNLVIAWFGHRERGITGVFLLPIFPRQGPRRLAKQPNKKHFASPTASEHNHSTRNQALRCSSRQQRARWR
jgi:hypothetical protein